MSKKQPIVAEVRETGNSLLSMLDGIKADALKMQQTLKDREGELRQKLAQQKKELDEQRRIEAARLIELAHEEKANRQKTASEAPEQAEAPAETSAEAQSRQEKKEKTEMPVQTKGEQPETVQPAAQEEKKEQEKPAEEKQPASEPAPKERTDRPQGAYQQRGDRPQGAYQQRGDRPQGTYQPRGDRPQGAYQQRGDRPQGAYQQRGDRPQGAYQQRGDRPQGGYQQRTDRPQGTYQPRGDRPQGAYQQRGDRPQGAYQQRGDRPQGAYQQRSDRPQGARGGYQKPAAAVFEPPMEKERVSNYDPNKKMYRNTRDNEKKTPNKRDLARQQSRMGVDDDVWRGKKKKKESAQSKMEPIKIEYAVMTTEEISIKDLSEKLGKPAADIIKKLFMLGIMATINNEVDYDTAALVATDYGIELEQKIAKTFEETMTDADEESEGDNNEERPPIVTIMGHVDHGKTSLLDAIRNTNVTAHEAGGITQHIGAYTVEHNGRKITFLDTPGHEAFTSMRARGAQVTDIAILVVAADDGVMPQTIEAINHAQAANVPIIVAINKMDKPGANPDRVKQELTNNGIVPEEWGGDAIIVPVSALKGEGIDNLLEMILLVADVNQYKANSSKKARGAIIEARLDKGRGPVATVLIQNGTLHVGDTVVAGTAFGHVRAMMDDKGRRVQSAGPSMPVEVLGFNDVPEAGDRLYVTEDDKLSRLVAQERKDKIKAEQIKARSKASLDDLFNQIQDGSVKELNLIVKADVQGSVEAVKQALEKLSNDKVKVKVIHGAVGAIKESDVILAAASNAIIIGFNVRPDSMASAAAEREEVDMRMYRVIYNAIEDVQAAMNGMLDPEFKETVIGHAEIRETFKVPGVGVIAGSYVTDGSIQRNAGIRLLRDNIVIHEGKISSLKRFKDDVKEVNAGYECGVGIENYNDIKQGDVFEAFIMEQIKNV